MTTQDTLAGLNNIIDPENSSVAKAATAHWIADPNNPNNVLMVDNETGKVLQVVQGQDFSFGHSMAVVSPVLTAMVPGLANIIGSTITGGAVGTAANTAIGNAVIGTVLNGGDVKKGIINAGAGYLGGQVANSDAVAGALKDAGITSTSITDAVKNTASGATSALVKGQDIGAGALAGGTSSLLNSGLTYAADKSGLSDSLTDKQLASTTGAAAAYAAAKLKGATDAQALLAAATAAGTTAAKSGSTTGKDVPVVDMGPTSYGTNSDAAFWKSIGIDPATTGQWASPSNKDILNLIDSTSGAGGSTPDNLVVKGTADNTNYNPYFDQQGTVDADPGVVNVVGGKGVNNAEPGFENWVDPDAILVTGKRPVTTPPDNPNEVTVTDSRLVKPPLDLGTTTVDTFTPSTDINTILTTPTVTPPGPKVTPPGPGIVVTPPGPKVTPPPVTATTKTPASSGPGTNVSNSSTPGTNYTSQYDPGLVELMDEIFGTHLYAPQAKASSQNKTVKAAHGGSIEDLLKLLRS